VNVNDVGRVLLFQLFLISIRLTALPTAVALMNARQVAARFADGDAQQRAILQGVSDVIFTTDAKGAWTYLNPAWQRLTGFRVDRSLGRPFVDFIHDEDKVAALEMFGPLISGAQRECRNEVRYACTDGEYRWAEASVRAITDAAGRFVGAFGTIVDINDRKLTDSQMRAEEARYRAIFDTAVDAIAVIDIQGSIHSFNPAAERIFGYDAKEVIGQDVSILMERADASAHGGHLNRYAAGGPPRIIGIGRELVGRRRDGTLFPLELSIAEWERDGTKFFTGHMRDISVRRAAEDRLKAATELTEANNRLLMMAEALAHVGHWRVDIAAGKLLWSDEVYRIHGRSTRGGDRALPSRRPGPRRARIQAAFA
jgi:PAS domain S-box-containing protein